MLVRTLLAATLGIAVNPAQPTINVVLASYEFIDSAHHGTIRAAIRSALDDPVLTVRLSGEELAGAFGLAQAPNIDRIHKHVASNHSTIETSDSCCES